MTVNELFWIAMAIVVCIILPICMVIGVLRHLRGGNRRKDTHRAGCAVGNALQELDPNRRAALDRVHDPVRDAYSQA